MTNPPFVFQIKKVARLCYRAYLVRYKTSWTSKSVSLISRLIIGVALGVGLSGVSASPLFIGLGDLPGGDVDSRALAISADGSVVVGASTTSSGSEAFRWTASGGMVGLGDLPGNQVFSLAKGVSSDGSVVTGVSLSSSGTEAFRWTANGGMVGLGDLPGGEFFSDAHGISADGSAIVGAARNVNVYEAFRWTAEGGVVGLGDLPAGTNQSLAHATSANGSVVVGEAARSPGREAFRWTAQSGMVVLGSLPSSEPWSVIAKGVSADGSVVVGSSSSLSTVEAFRWTADGGMVGLGYLPGRESSSATGVSADGSVIVGESSGSSGREPFIWDSADGMRSLSQLLVAGGVDLTAWTLDYASAISADGRTIVGSGTHAGTREAWLARIDAVVGANPVKIVGYDVVNADISGTGGWAHEYSGTITPTSGTLANYSGGTGTMADGVFRDTTTNNTQSFWTIPNEVTITIYFDKSYILNSIYIYGGDSGFGPEQNVVPGLISGFDFTLDQTTQTLKTTGVGPIGANGLPVNDWADLVSAGLPGTPVSSVTISNISIDLGQSAFSIAEIELYSTSTNAEPTLQLSSTNITFGALGLGQSIAETITIVNTGSADLELGTVTLSGNLVDFSLNNNSCDSATLATGLSCTFDANFAPASVGLKLAAISIPSNAAGSPHSITIGGEGVEFSPAISLSEEQLDFGYQYVGSRSARKDVTISSAGSSDLEIGTVAIVGANPEDFVLSTTSCSGASLPPGGQCGFGVYFDPLADGLRSAVINIPTNIVTSATTVAAFGSGVPQDAQRCDGFVTATPTACRRFLKLRDTEYLGIPHSLATDDQLWAYAKANTKSLDYLFSMIDFGGDVVLFVSRNSNYLPNQEEYLDSAQNAEDARSTLEELLAIMVLLEVNPVVLGVTDTVLSALEPISRGLVIYKKLKQNILAGPLRTVLEEYIRQREEGLSKNAVWDAICKPDLSGGCEDVVYEEYINLILNLKKANASNLHAWVEAAYSAKLLAEPGSQAVRVEIGRAIAAEARGDY